jgi:sodium/hydrogen antiporter
MHHLNIIVTLLGALVLVLGLGSNWLSRSPVPPTLLALVFGVLVGPQVAGLIDLSGLGDRSSVLEGAARLTLAIGLVSVALRIPRAYPRRNWRKIGMLVVGAMIPMWAISTLLVWWLLPITFLLAALIGAIVTATDPIAATPIVTGELAERGVPERIRHAISFESGANDGLSYLFVFLPFLLLTRPPGDALHHFLTKILLYDVGVATLVGVVIGYAGGKLLQAAERRDLIESDWRLVYTVALAFFSVGAGRLIGSDEVLVVFATGVAFVQVVSGEDRASEEHGQEAVNRFFSIPIFALLGAAIPWDGWAKLGWTGVLLALAILLLRRPPVMLLLRPWLPDVRSRGDALFMGWFGPIAVAAIYYAALMEHRLKEPLIWDVVSLVVCASVLLHGASGAPFTRWYGRQQARNGEAAGPRAPDPRP